MELYISSGYHITRPRKRISAIEDQVDSVDFVFAEAPLSDNPALKSIFLNFVFAPLLMLTMYIWVSILYISNKVLSTDDGMVIEHIENNYRAKLIKTDINMNRIIEKNRILWLISHGLLVIISLLAVPEFISWVHLDSVFIASITSLALAGLAIFVIVLAVIDPVRNRTMADDILKYAKESPDAQAVLVVGNHHKKPIEDALQGESEVSILNPE